VIVLDLRKISNFCDYFVILGATSLRHLHALAETIQEELQGHNIKSFSKVNSRDESGWLVLDFASVIGHLFYKPVREFYNLERLWSDAKKVRVPRTKVL